MSSDYSSCLSLAEAEALYDEARNCSSAEDVTSLLGRVNDGIKDYVTVSSSESCNPATYKTLTNALKLLEGREKILSTRPSFSFKTPKAVLPAAKTVESVSAVCPPTEACHKANGSKQEPSSHCTVCLSDGKLHVYGAVDTQVVRTAEELQGVGTIILKNLERCRVVLLGAVESVYMSNVKDSIIWIGISRASVILESMSGSTVLVCCSQLRIASSQHSKFLVDTVTVPIIESSSGMVFSKNHVSYPEYDKHLEASGLKGKLLEVQKAVKDFSWHHDTPSPNWRVEDPQTPVMLAPENLVHSSGEDTGDTTTFNATDWHTLENL